jgi:hypothetical protein
MEEISRPILPIIIEVKSILDILETCSDHGVLMHREVNQIHYYYYYISIGETLVVLMVYKDTKPFKRYIGNLKGKVLESNEPNSDCYFPLIDVTSDPIFELTLMVENEDDNNKEMPKVQ